MKIETLTEKITNGKFSAIVDYASDTASVDMGDGSEPIAIPFGAVERPCRLPRHREREGRLMNIEIKCMDIVNFKCFRNLHLDFHSGTNTIYGQNSAGKSSVI